MFLYKNLFFFNIFYSFNPNHVYWDQRLQFSGNLPGMFCLFFGLKVWLLYWINLRVVLIVVCRFLVINTNFIPFCRFLAILQNFFQSLAIFCILFCYTDVYGLRIDAYYRVFRYPVITVSLLLNVFFVKKIDNKQKFLLFQFFCCSFFL